MRKVIVVLLWLVVSILSLAVGIAIATLLSAIIYPMVRYTQMGG